MPAADTPQATMTDEEIAQGLRVMADTSVRREGKTLLREAARRIEEIRLGREREKNLITAATGLVRLLPELDGVADGCSRMNAHAQRKAVAELQQAVKASASAALTPASASN